MLLPPSRFNIGSFSFMLQYHERKKRSDEPEPLLPGPAKGHDRTAPGRRPFRGVTGTASVITPQAGWPTFGQFGRRQEPTLTHGSDRQRVQFGPLVTLVGISVVQKENLASAPCQYPTKMILSLQHRGCKEKPTGTGEFPAGQPHAPFRFLSLCEILMTEAGAGGYSPVVSSQRLALAS
jgi:hypothetical protein